MNSLPILSTLSLLALSSLFVGCSKSDPQPVVAPALELLTNVSIEDGTTSPSGWYHASNNPNNTNYVFDWSMEAASSGTRSLKINSTINNGPTNFGYWYQTILLTSNEHAGKTVQLTVKIKGVNLVAATGYIGASIALAGFTGSTQSQFVSSGSTTQIAGTIDWITYSVKLSDIKSGTDRLLIYLILGTQTTGMIYFDDVSVKELK